MKTLKMIPLAIALAASMGGDAASGPQYPERPANLDFERGDFGWKLGSDAWSIDERGGRNGSKCLAWARSACREIFRHRPVLSARHLPVCIPGPEIPR